MHRHFLTLEPSQQLVATEGEDVQTTGNGFVAFYLWCTFVVDQFPGASGDVQHKTSETAERTQNGANVWQKNLEDQIYFKPKHHKTKLEELEGLEGKVPLLMSKAHVSPRVANCSSL